MGEPYLTIRSATPADLPRLVALNAAGEPGVAAADAALLGRLLGMAAAAPVIEAEGAIAAFLIALAPGADYGSANYGWFMRRGGPFLYIDRVAVAPSARGRGLGQALYAALPAAAPLVCEVNTVPPNPGSLAFHARLGFHEVGHAAHEPGAYEVAFLERPLGAPIPTSPVIRPPGWPPAFAPRA